MIGNKTYYGKDMTHFALLSLSTINYGSFAYFVCFLIPVFLTAGLYFLLRRRSARTKKIVVAVLLFVNLAQHLFKSVIYPQYYGQGFAAINTAYNICAFLIIASPVVFFTKSGVWKDFIACLGCAAGMGAMLVPYWFIGQTVFQWEAFRFYFCHGLLFLTSALPPLLGLHRLNWRSFWKLPFLYYLMLAIILVNDVVCFSLGMYGDPAGDLWATLDSLNPGWCIRPNPSFGVINDIIFALTPDIFLGDAATGKPYVPILWYAIPLYLLIAVAGFAVLAVADRKRLKKDFSDLGQRLSSLRKKRTKEDADEADEQKK